MLWLTAVFTYGLPLPLGGPDWAPGVVAGSRGDVGNAGNLQIYTMYCTVLRIGA